MLHTILGAGGSIGNSLAIGLLKSKENVRLVSRRKFGYEGAEIMKGDLLSYADVLAAVKGSDIVYLCAGLKYDHKVWADEWPKIMSNIIGVCKNTNIKLVFFDNVYMYGKVEGKMTEGTPYNPISKKGETRAKIATMLQHEMKTGNIKAIIARAGDLYGPNCSINSIPYIMAISSMMKGKGAKWLISADIPHSFTYTIDCAQAMYVLSQDENAFGQIWHMPTSNPPLTGKMFIEMIAEVIGGNPKYTELKKWVIKLGSFFNPQLKEVYEMLYQNEYPYYFDSSKFEKLYDYRPVPYEKGIKDTIQFLIKQAPK